MNEFTVKTLHDKKAITAMTLANHYLYHADKVRKVAGIGIVLVFGGFILEKYSSSSALPIILIFIGCLVLANVEYPARAGAKMVLDQIGENYPTIELRFTANTIVIKTPQDTGTYSYYRIKRVGEDKNYFFLFLGDRNAYVVNKANLKGGTVEEFRTFIEEKTEAKTESVVGFWRKAFTFRIKRNKK